MIPCNRFGLAFLTVLRGLICAACAPDGKGRYSATAESNSIITKTNYEQIHTHMSLGEVEAILGQSDPLPAAAGEPIGFFEPQLGHVSITRRAWTEGSKRIVITFFGDQAADKQQEGL